MEPRTGSGVRNTRSRCESPAVPGFLPSLLCFPFAFSHLATSILLFDHNIKYTCVWGGDSGGRRRFAAASREATLPYSLFHRICKKLMYLGWGKRGGSDGVNKCGRESSPRGLPPLVRELPWTFLPSRPSCCPAAYHHSLGTDAPRSAPAWTGYRAQLEPF